MKFTLSLLAALLGVVSASGHNGSANGTVTTPVSGGGGGGGGGADATTPAATTTTTANSTETDYSITTTVSLTVELPTDVNATDVYAVSVDTTNGYKLHQTGCPTSPPSAVFVCSYVTVLNNAFVANGAVSSYLTAAVSAASRRSLTETTERRLTGTAMNFPMKVFAEDDTKKGEINSFAEGTGVLAAVQTAANALGVTAPTVASATAPVDSSAGTTTGTTPTTSNAFEMGVSALAIVFSAFSLF
jgi:hypothetical protein